MHWRWATQTIPTGMEENDRPMSVDDEVWTSPDLKITMLEKRTDSRFGEYTRRVTNLDISEPSPLLPASRISESWMKTRA
jgi:hypothetical protein